MMRSTVTVLTGLVWLALACGGRAKDGVLDVDGGEPRVVEVIDGVAVFSDVNDGLVPLDADVEPTIDLGRTEQPILFAPSGSSRQPGFTPGDEVSCNKTDTSQNCIVPPVNSLTKGWVYYLEGGHGPRISGFGEARFDVYSQLNQAYVDIVAQGAEVSGTGALDFRETLDINDPDLTFVVDAGGTSDFCSGTSSKGNVCFTGSTTGISHNSSLVGTYHRMVNAPAIHIDYEAIRTKAGWTTANKQNALHQAVVLAFLKGIGQGPKANPLSTRCDQTAVTTAFWCTLPSNAACKLNGWGDFGTPGSVALLGADCGD